MDVRACWRFRRTLCEWQVQWAWAWAWEAVDCRRLRGDNDGGMTTSVSGCFSREPFDVCESLHGRLLGWTSPVRRVACACLALSVPVVGLGRPSQPPTSSLGPPPLFSCMTPSSCPEGPPC
jgi:hypothetical protein